MAGNLSDAGRVINVLKGRYRQGRPLQPAAIKQMPALWKAIHDFFPSYEDAIAAAGITHAHTHWTRELVVQRLGELAAAGIDLNPGTIYKTDQRILYAMKRYFGSYDAAIAAAGLDPTETRLFEKRRTDQEILDELRKLHQEGKDLSAIGLSRHSPSLLSALIRFGSRRKALAAAGIDPDTIKMGYRVIWTREKILHDLRAVHTLWQNKKDKNRSPYLNIRRTNSSLGCAISKEFGSIGAALDAAGLPQTAYKAQGNWSREKILQGLREIDPTGTSLTNKAIAKANRTLVQAARLYFGTVQAAVRAAGLQYTQLPRGNKKWTSELVVAALRNLAGPGGTISFMRVKSCGDRSLSSACRTYFGSVQAAAKAARLEYTRWGNAATAANAPHHWTHNSILATLKEMHAKGEDLRYRPVQEKHSPLFWAAKELFGAYVTAVREAGIDYGAMSQAQLALQRAQAQAKVEAEAES